MSGQDKPQGVPGQQQHKDSHGTEKEMSPKPQYDAPWYKGSGKLEGKVALITGGDSGIGRSVAILFAREGANVAIVYFKNDHDAEETKSMIEKEGRKCLPIKGDISQKQFCTQAVQKTVETFKHLDILVNNAAVQFPQESIEDISEEQLDTTFRTNIYSMFFLTQSAMPHLKKSEAGCVINTTSVTTFKGNPKLLDYASTKGAIVGFTRSLAQNLASSGIRVNGIAPGPIWTPLIPSTFSKEKVENFGKNVPMERPGQPEECAPAYVYLASKDSSYMTGQVLHINGGNSY